MPVGHGRAENYAGKWEVLQKVRPCRGGRVGFVVELRYNILIYMYSVESGVECGDINELRGELFFRGAFSTWLCDSTSKL